MDCKTVIHRLNTLEINLQLFSKGTDAKTPEYIISSSAIFQVKQQDGRWYFRFVKLHDDDPLTYAINITIEIFDINKKFITNDGTWQEMVSRYIYPFTVKVILDIFPGECSFAPLHEDAELTDFELRGEDGSVHMHRAVLAASSPVLRRMLSGPWRESSEGVVDVPGTSRTTLQNLKDYVYLRTLPETGLEQLLLIASYYMMPELEQKCVFKILNSFTADNVYNLFEFITKHKVTRLLLLVLECIQTGTVDVKEMRNHLLHDMNEK
ncbi:hypothetical protein ABMA27_006225 [Loxostege sticticalis]|uniref:BTB domain-containing protein n=1 Tax=Loxostege sticticalis TaxID=481309 RepID=A0ABR3HI20_LOXSC